MTNTKINSPFYTVENFISPANCQYLIDKFGATNPTVKSHALPLDHEYMTHISERLAEHIPAIEAKHQAIAELPVDGQFKQYRENPTAPCELHGCANAKLLRRKWLKTKDYDLVGYVWLKDFNNGVPLDDGYEVYGGKLEFPIYNFSLLPQRGTLVLFPAGPHFITAISPVLAGSLEQLTFGVKLSRPDKSLWLYEPSLYPGDYTNWFD